MILQSNGFEERIIKGLMIFYCNPVKGRDQDRARIRTRRQPTQVKRRHLR